MSECKTCSVFGHRKINITKEIEEKLYFIFEELIKNGCEIFYFGGFGEFDELCHEVITKLKETYTQIKRIYCLSDRRHLKLSKRPCWLKNEDYEEFIYIDLDFDWWYQRLYYRNCAIIDKSDVVIFYVEKREDSGAYKAYKHANRKKKTIFNIYENVYR